MLSTDTPPVTQAQPYHRGEGPGGSADDDVLRRRALQPHRIDAT